VLPSLMGIPVEMQQVVAVSDAKSHPEHPWNYSWASPDDEAKMKSAVEDIARDALGIKPPPPPAVHAPKRTPNHKPVKPAPPPPPPPPTPLEGSSSWLTAPVRPWCFRRTPQVRFRIKNSSPSSPSRTSMAMCWCC
jgi:hypothetical protein